MVAPWGQGLCLSHILTPALTTQMWIWRYSIYIWQRKDRWEGGGTERRLSHSFTNFRHALGEYTASLSYFFPPTPSLPSVWKSCLKYMILAPLGLCSVVMKPHLISVQFSPRNLEGTLQLLLVPRTENSVIVGSPSSAMYSVRRREEASLWSKKNGFERRIGKTGEAMGGRVLGGAKTHSYAGW